MTTQCTGRTNSCSPAPQRMRFAIGSASSAALTMPGSSAAVGSPFFVPTNMQHRVPSAHRPAAAASTPTPHDAANPAAALVGWPVASNALRDRGSLPSDLLVRLPIGHAVHAHCEPARRREPFDARRARSTAAASPCAMPSASACASVNSDFGGSSSVPSSNRKSRLLMRSRSAPRRA